MGKKLEEIRSVRIDGDKVYVDTVFLDKNRKKEPKGEEVFVFSSVEKV